MNTQFFADWSRGARSLVAAAVLSSGLLSGAQDALSAGAEIVDLPPVTIQGFPLLPPPESWRYAEFAGFEVLSSDSDAGTAKLLKQFAVFEQALRSVWPMPKPRSAPTTIVLCGRGQEFNRFLPEGKTRAELAAASLFLRRRDQAVILVDVEVGAIALSQFMQAAERQRVVVPLQFEVDANRELFREYIRWMIAESGPRPPAWLEEGFLQLITSIEHDARGIRFGRIKPITDPMPSTRVGEFADKQVSRNWDFQTAVDIGGGGSPDHTAELSEIDPSDTANPGWIYLLQMMEQYRRVMEADRPFTATLSRQSLMPFNKLFAVAHDAPEARHSIGENAWAKQCHAFLHLCLYGQKRKWQQPFGEFVRRLGREPVSEKMFQECFGLSYRQMATILRGYVQAPDYTEFYRRFEPGEKLAGEPPALREATQAEIGRIKGDAYLLAGKNEEGRREYRLAYLRGERDPRLLASLGAVEKEEGELERARRFLEAAVKAGVDRPAPYVELARLRFAEAQAGPAREDGRLDLAQTARVLGPLLQARQFRPELPEVYELIAITWSASAERPTEEDLLVLVAGAERFPDQPALLFNAALVHARAGRVERARELARLGAERAAAGKGRARFTALLAALERKPEPPR